MPLMGHSDCRWVKMLTKFRCDALMNNKKSLFVVLMLVIFIGLGALISNSIVIEKTILEALTKPI